MILCADESETIWSVYFLLCNRHISNQSKGIMWIDESEPSYELVGACPGLSRMVRFATTITDKVYIICILVTPNVTDAKR